MLKFTSRASLALAFLLVAGCNMMTNKEGGAAKLDPANVPPKVMDSAKARFPDAQWRSITRERENNMTIYDFELSSQGKKFEMDIKDDGTILEIEKEIAASELPEQARRTVASKYPHGTIKETLQKSLIKDGKETPHEYEVVVDDGGKEKEVTMSLDGKVTEESGH